MIETYTIKPEDKPTDKMLKEVQEASRKPITFDEDCPEMSDIMMKEFRSAVIQRNRKKKA